MAIRVGVVGLNYGARVHLPAFQNNTKYEVVAVAARTPGRAEAVARENKIASYYTDARQLLAAPDVDLVSIATPPGTHAGYAAAALAGGKHALVEIGFVSSLPDAQILVAMAREQRRLGTPAFVLRYVPNLRMVTDLLNQKAVGEPRLFRLNFFANLLAIGQPEWRWLYEAEVGGGILAGSISHGFDLAREWFGPVREVDGTLTTLSQVVKLPPGRQAADDTGFVTLHFESGLLGAVNFSAAVAYPHVDLEVHGSDGSLLIEGFGDEVSMLSLGQTTARTIYPPEDYLIAARGLSGLPAGFEHLLDRLAPALAGAAAPPDLPTFEDGLEVTRLLDAVRLASRERRRVRVDEVA